MGEGAQLQLQREPRVGTSAEQEFSTGPVLERQDSASSGAASPRGNAQEARCLHEGDGGEVVLGRLSSGHTEVFYAAMTVFRGYWTRAAACLAPQTREVQ